MKCVLAGSGVLSRCKPNLTDNHTVDSQYNAFNGLAGNNATVHKHIVAIVNKSGRYYWINIERDSRGGSQRLFRN